MPAGRPTIYSEELLEKAKAYIDQSEDVPRAVGKVIMIDVNLPTIEGLAFHLEIHKDTIYTWIKEKPEFSDLIGQLQAKQVKRLINMGLSGMYNPTIAKVLLAKHGYKESQEVEQKTIVKDERIDESKLTDDELRFLAQIQRKSSIS